MTLEKKINMLAKMTGVNAAEESDILEVYLELAAQKILNRMYPFKTDYEGLEVPDKYVAIQLSISNYLLNKRGAEGQIQHIEGNIHRNYGSADVPEAMLQGVVPYCNVLL